MGWKGTIRSIGAAVRAAERDAKRRQRELERQQKQYDKMQELRRAAHEVDLYENHIELIQSMHKDCSERVDWKSIASSLQPQKPENPRAREKRADLKIQNYKPGIIDKIFKTEEKSRKKLRDKLSESIREDEKEYAERIQAWEKEVEDWKESVSMANRLLSGEGQAKVEVIKELDPFSELSTLGSGLEFNIRVRGIVEATLHVHGREIVPSEIKGLLSSGHLSMKKMPQGRFNEIHQDYVCSCTLRVANELFAILPEDVVIVTAVDELLNTKTGHKEELPILSAYVTRVTLGSLSMNTVDPSDSMGNFVHNMSFKKNKGFEAVERIDPEKFADT